ncbi:hypothetical protein J6590_028770 [Homalodisca vitripennis]|nr:hypothetical protein J6590_028770 [Homalodisca vitripennis]
MKSWGRWRNIDEWVEGGGISGEALFVYRVRRRGASRRGEAARPGRHLAIDEVTSQSTATTVVSASDGVMDWSTEGRPSPSPSSRPRPGHGVGRSVHQLLPGEAGRRAGSRGRRPSSGQDGFRQPRTGYLGNAGLPQVLGAIPLDSRCNCSNPCRKPLTEVMPRESLQF